MKKQYKYPFGEPYEAPDVSLLLLETGNAFCETSGEGEEIEPGTLDPWGSF
jgi:hypothetical protein